MTFPLQGSFLQHTDRAVGMVGVSRPKKTVKKELTTGVAKIEG
jgi:hypothetical protein